MSLENALVAIKSANSTLNALIGTRFYPDVCPQQFAMPAVRFQEISYVPSDAMTPVIVNNHYRVQMDGYAATSILRAALRDALVSAFYGYSGSIGGETVKAILIDSERKFVEDLDTEAQSYVVSVDFKVDLS